MFLFYDCLVVFEAGGTRSLSRSAPSRRVRRSCQDRSCRSRLHLARSKSRTWVGLTCKCPYLSLHNFKTVITSFYMHFLCIMYPDSKTNSTDLHIFQIYEEIRGNRTNSYKKSFTFSVKIETFAEK